MILTFENTPSNSWLSLGGPGRQTALHFIYPRGRMGDGKEERGRGGINLRRLEQSNPPPSSWPGRLSEYHPLLPARAHPPISPLLLNMCFISTLFGWEVILPSFIEGHKTYSGVFSPLSLLCITFTFSIV